jgi:uncharacterized protein (TIGR02147 family)
MFQTQDYREILKQRLEERCRANARYSLRAFARDLKIAPSRLSEILRGKQGLSKEYSQQIAQRMGMSDAEQKLFTSMVVLTDARSKKERDVAKTLLSTLENAEQKLNLVREDTFRIIEDWYHYAILELTSTDGFKSSPLWISKRLGISLYEAESAIERLKRVGLLEEVKGVLTMTHKAVITTDDIPSESIRTFNKQILAKASEAISAQTVEEREIGSLTIAIDERDLPEFKDMIRKFRRKVNQTAMAKGAAKGSKLKHVYCLAVQFFRLTTKDLL